MSRFILRGRGTDSAQLKKDLDKITQLPGVKIVDRASEKMLLVNARSEQKLQEQLKSLPNWTVTKETTVPLPDPKPRLKKRTS